MILATHTAIIRKLAFCLRISLCSDSCSSALPRNSLSSRPLTHRLISSCLVLERKVPGTRGSRTLQASCCKFAFACAVTLAIPAYHATRKVYGAMPPSLAPIRNATIPTRLARRSSSLLRRARWEHFCGRGSPPESRTSPPDRSEHAAVSGHSRTVARQSVALARI